ncbi:MAG TPA: alpha-2-macroglobulin family protein [Candidatus Nitrosotenuis sp.]|nr:alpha-2-macroglobulin family protein [Candidatus Nitrosotenuis sp.]
MVVMRAVWIALVFLTAQVQAEPALDGPKIIRITPEGDNTYEADQIVIEFNQDMVPLGKAAVKSDDLPIQITPEIKCNWRWLNTKTLACHVHRETPLVSATKYKIHIQPTLKSAKGLPLDKEYSHEFTTTRPGVSYVTFSRWLSPTRPAFKVFFNQPVTIDSVKDSLLIEDKLKPNQTFKVMVTKPAHEEINDEEVSDDPLLGDKNISRVWLVEAKDDLGMDLDYRLLVKPGLKSTLGNETNLKQEELKSFKTHGEFKVIGISCQTLDGEEILITPQQDQKNNKKCNPLVPIRLVFSSPVLTSQIRKNIVLSPDPTGGHQEEKLWGEQEDFSRLMQSPEGGYATPLRYGLKAASEYTIRVKPRTETFLSSKAHWIKGLFSDQPETDLEDEFGRPLYHPFEIKFSLDHRKPNFEIIHKISILEKKADSEVPLYVNNLKKAHFTYHGLTSRGLIPESTMTYDIPIVQDIQFAIPFNIRDMLKGLSGVIYGTLATDPKVDKGEQGNVLFAQVTPFQIYVKMGHFNTAVWVTDLATGEVIPHAKVTIYRDTLSNLGLPKDILAQGETNEAGIAMMPGTSEIDPRQKLLESWGQKGDKLFIRVDKDKDLGLIPLTYDFKIDMWRASGESFWGWSRQKYRHVTSWGTTAQGIYRVGDTIQYKLYLRTYNNNQLTLPPKARYDLTLVDPTNKVVHQVEDIKLNEFGAFSGEYPLPKNAMIGWYDFRIKAYMPDMVEERTDNTTGNKPVIQPTIELYPMRVLVSDFTPAPFKVTVDVNNKVVKPGQELTALTSAKMHAGGAYTNAKAQITAVLEQEVFSSQHPSAQKFAFGRYSSDHKSYTLLQHTGVMNNKGEFEATLKIPAHPIGYGKLTVEGAVHDDRGKSITSRTAVDYFFGEAFLGLRQKEWLLKVNKPAEIEFIAVNMKGEPVKGISGQIVVEKKRTTAAKVKTAGNVYKTNENHEWVEVTRQAVTSTLNAEIFTFTPKEAGLYRILGSAKDAHGTEQVTELQVYVTGEDFVLWGEETDYYLPLVPERTEYQVDEKVRILVKNPVPHAKAWVTIERFGVIDSFIKELDTNTPIIEFPVKENYLPNFYVSVVMMAPRVEHGPLKIGQLDMGKPICRIGYTGIKVTDKYKYIDLKAKSELEVYKPRDKVKVNVEAKIKNPGAPQEPIELAVVVLDEAVLDLIHGGQNYFDPYDGLYKKEELDLTNFSLLTNLIGRQKFEKKGANPGGDGGVDLNMRNIFKFVSYWNPSLKLGKDHKATIEFEAPDNLTGWRVFVLAATPTDRFGLGEAKFTVNRPTEVRPVMPNLVNEQDKFTAGFSVMNRTDKPRTVQVKIDAQGNALVDQKPVTISQDITLEPFQRTTVTLPIETGQVPLDQEGIIHFKVYAGDDVDKDATEHKLLVKKMRVLETMAVSGTVRQDSYHLPIAIPKDIFTDVGGLTLTLSPSLISNIEGTFAYMKTYPYTCWEQKLSKAVMAAYYPRLKPYLPHEFDWSDSKIIPQETLAALPQYQAGNGGIGYFLADDKFTDAYLSAFTALALNWLKEEGWTISESSEHNLDKYLDTLLRYDFGQEYYTPTLKATTRALILDALSVKGKVTPDDLERLTQHIPQMSLFGKAAYINAAMRFPGYEPMIASLVREILSSFHESSGKIALAETQPEDYSRILSTPLRDTCAMLHTLCRYATTSKQAHDLVGDKPEKLVRTIIESRKGKAWWPNTQENLFCARALATYSKIYEAERPDIVSEVQLNNQSWGQAKFEDYRDQPRILEKKFTVSDPRNKIDLTVNKQGLGTLYLTSRLSYAPKGQEIKATIAGLEIKREYSLLKDNKWILLKGDMHLNRGDIVRIDLYVMVPANRNFVVLSDPIPGGLEPVNRNLATSSLLGTAKADSKPGEGAYYHQVKNWIEFFSSYQGFYHEEMRHDVVRYYSDTLPQGNYHLSYTAQVIADGEFTAPAAFAEEMYNPDIYGRSDSEKVKVSAQTK